MTPYQLAMLTALFVLMGAFFLIVWGIVEEWRGWKARRDAKKSLISGIVEDPPRRNYWGKLP